MNISEWIDAKKGKEFIDKELFDSIIFSLREDPWKWEIEVDSLRGYRYLVFKVPKEIRLTIQTDEYGGSARLTLYNLTKRQEETLKQTVFLFPPLSKARLESEVKREKDIINLKESLRRN